MKKIAVLNIKGEKVKDINLNENVWGIEPNDAVLYDAIVLAQNNQRQGSTRAPHWPGGGVVFGPHPRSYSKKMNKKERRLALLSALSYKFINSELVVIDDLKFETNKYKESANMFKALNASKNILVVTDELDENVILSTRNNDEVILLQDNEINVLDLVSADKLIITEKAVKNIEEVLS